MKYAILSDIHANLEALTTVLDKCRLLGVDAYVSLGDVVGYNADPKKCLDIARSLNFVAAVKGNHDEYVSNGDNAMEGFNPHAKAAVLWTRSQLNGDDLAYLASLPYRVTIRGTAITIVHGTLDGPGNWGYIFDSHNAADNFSYQFTPLCFCGHSHVPLAFIKKPVTMHAERQIEDIPSWTWKPNEDQFSIDPSVADEITLKIEKGFKYLINVGSVGQPRNRDPRASFAIYDSEENTVTRYRLPYDVAAAQQKIMAAGLPERLYLRLAQGS